MISFFQRKKKIPTIDFSLLTSGTPDQRSKVIQDIRYACSEWGFFMVINHSMPEKLMKEMVKASKSFFEQRMRKRESTQASNRLIQLGMGQALTSLLVRHSFGGDHLKVHVHPHVNALRKPPGYREITNEYCKKTREVARELVKPISFSLGLAENYIEGGMELESGSQLLVVNCYLPCPQPEVAMGLLPHSDHGRLTLLIQNELSGLQLPHNQKWVLIIPLPNSILVNTGDHMEILTNGRYKSVVHRAGANNKATRISIGTAHGPPLDTIINPAPELVDSETHPAAYRGITYREYLVLQQSNQLDGKSCLNKVRV